MAKRVPIGKTQEPKIKRGKRGKKRLKKSSGEARKVRRKEPLKLPELSGSLKTGKWFGTTYAGRRWIKFNLNFEKNPDRFNDWEQILKSEDTKGALVEVIVTIKYDDLHRFDIERAQKILRKAFHLKPIVPRVITWGLFVEQDQSDKDQLTSIIVNPLEHVQNFIHVRRPVNKGAAEKIAKEIIKAYIPSFKGFLKELPPKDRISFNYKAVKRKKKKLKK